MEFINSIIYPTIKLFITILTIGAGITFVVWIITYVGDIVDNLLNYTKDKNAFTYLYVALVIFVGIFVFCLTIIGMVTIARLTQGAF